jgi:hypothetical protein
MKNGQPLILKVGVIAFATVLMTAFVVFRGYDGSRSFTDAPSIPSSWEMPIDDSPLVESGIRIRLATPEERQVVRSYLSSSKSAPIVDVDNMTSIGPKYVIEVDTPHSAAQQVPIRATTDPATQRMFLSSSKSGVVQRADPYPWMTDAVLQAIAQREKRWDDSVARAEAMRTLVVDRYGSDDTKMITLDSLQRRVQRYFLPSTKSIQLHTYQRWESNYLDSLLNALVK